jgi:hypothetical protein
LFAICAVCATSELRKLEEPHVTAERAVEVLLKALKTNNIFRINTECVIIK